MQDVPSSIVETHVEILRAFARSDLARRAARIRSGRSEVLFSTRGGRFCLYALPHVEGSGTERTWVYGLLFVYDGMPSYPAPVWHAIKGTWSTMRYDDQVWLGPPDLIVKEAIAAGNSHRFVLPQDQRPDPGPDELP